MSCETMRTRILDRALDERPVDAALRAHLDSCAGCRDALAARTALLAEIDRVLTDEMREVPSPLLAARVRQAIEAEPRPRASWRGAAWTGWVPAGVIVALAVIVGVVVRDRLGSSVATVPIVSSPSVTAKMVEPTRPSSEALASGTGAAREGGGQSIDEAGGQRSPRQLLPDPAGPRPLRIEAASRTAPRVRSFPEVLVPEGEMSATLRLSAASVAHPLLVSTPEDEEAAARSSLQPLSIEKIEIAPLVLTPLEVGAPQPTTPSTS